MITIVITIRPIRALGAQPSLNGILVLRAHETRACAGGGVRRFACRTLRATVARKAILPRWTRDARFYALRFVSLYRIRSVRAMLARRSGFGVPVRIAHFAARRRAHGVLPGGAIVATGRIVRPIRMIRELVLRARFTIRSASYEHVVQGLRIRIRPFRAPEATSPPNGVLVRRAHYAGALAGSRVFAGRTRSATLAREAKLPRGARDARADARRKVFL